MSNPQTTFTDAEYVRALKSENAVHIQAITDKNERLERIAKRLEYLERNDANDN